MLSLIPLLAAAALAAVRPPVANPSVELDDHGLPLRCDDYRGRVVMPITFDAAVLRLAKLPRQKGEYETAAAFEERLAMALPSGGPLIVAKALDLSHVHYEADRARLEISLDAIDNLNVSYDEVFGPDTPYDGKIAYGGFGNADIVVSEHEATTGSYVGTNGYGAHARVTKTLRITKAIFDRALPTGDVELFSTTRGQIMATIPMPAADARLLKPKLSAAIVIVPKRPFYATGTKLWGDITIDSPEDVTQKISVIIADIACALILDGNRKVIATARAR